MMEFLISLLSTMFPLTGNDVSTLDFQTFTYGAKSPPALTSWRLSNPPKNGNQITNFAIISATLDWDSIKQVPNPQQPDELRIYTQFLLTLPTQTNGLRFLIHHARSWKTNWTAEPIETDLLKRLTIDAPEEVGPFAEKLLANNANASALIWFNWHAMMKARRKAEAFEYAVQHKLKTEIRLTTQFPCDTFETFPLLVLWPSKVRTDVYQYHFPTKTWGNTLIQPPNKTVYLQANWDKPQGNRYQRGWQRGPSWQITYTKKGNVLTRESTYVENCSYIIGTIDKDDFSETVMELSVPPKGYLIKTPTLIEVQP